ncbi:unnamed protein product [Phytomonas sp. Hart1]|nr:unnamed protein product [Phytomonas sp. Hart1]|eukprot:CCW68367.1 unnamed protein product [Phytomonas sp. isolate Hart1]
MRLKSNNVCCAFAWSPAKLETHAMIATASYIGSMNDDFDNEAYLEIRLVDVTQTDETEMPVIGSVALSGMAYKLDWSPHTGEQGIIAVSCSNNKVYIYSAAAILRSGAKRNEPQLQGQSRAPSPGLLWTIHEHHSPVRCCQFNMSEPQFLATGDDSGQWLLWCCPDAASGAGGGLTAPKNVQVIKNAAHSTSVVDIQWHPRYAHIIATASASGQVNVWNLKNVSLVTSLNVSKVSRGAGVTCIAWNPTAATQLAVGLDENHPVVQMWELKRSVAPIHEMVGHTSKISGISWNAQDTSMLTSCGCDGLTIWWDTGSGQKLGQLTPETNYMIDVKWCPVLPQVLATSSFEPLLCVSTAQDMSAFKGPADGSVAVPPKWMLRPCGASINLALDVVSLAPRTTNSLCVTHVRNRSFAASTNQKEKQELAQCPPGSPERVKWLQQHHHHLLAAVSKSITDRQPILEYLSQAAKKDNNLKRNPNSHDEDDPFAQITQENQKSYEDRASEHVAMGQIEEAVDVCIENGHYADAFTLAFLRGGSLIAKVHQSYVKYTIAQQTARRHVLLAGAVASGDFSSLLSGNIEMSWQEALSTIIAYIGEGFADACNRLGDVLKKNTNYEGAYACYVCGRNVDAIIELWRLQGIPPSQVVQNTILLEETTQRGALSPYFAECLFHRGVALIKDGQVNEAAEYLQRATNIGNENAALLVDRLKYLIPLQQSDKSVPYHLEPIPDQPTEACRQYFASLQGNSLAASQQQQQQQSQRPVNTPGPRPQAFEPPSQQQRPQLPMAAATVPGPQYTGQWTNPNPSAPPPPPLQPPQQVQQHQQHHQHQQQHHQQLQQEQQPLSQAPIPGAWPAAAPSSVPQTTSPFLPPPQPHGAPQPTSNAYPPLRHLNSSGSGLVMSVAEPSPGFPLGRGGPSAAPPGMPPPLPPQGMPYNAGKPHTAMMAAPSSQASSHTMPPAGGSSTFLNTRPQAPFIQATSSGERVSAPPPGPGSLPPYPQQHSRPSASLPLPTTTITNASAGSILEINVGVLMNPTHQKLVGHLQKQIPHIADPRRRASIDHAAMQLFSQLQANLLSDDLVQKLLNYVELAGTHKASILWREISDSYFKLIQPFFNLRFL